MTLIDFLSEFPDEARCKAKFKEFREQAGVVCHKCGGTNHYWKRDREQWECKSCAAMGKRDGEYVLAGRLELDEGFFSTVTPSEKRDEPLKRGHGSQRKTKVLVMAESEIVESSKKGAKPRRVGYLKMRVIDNMSKETINGAVRELASGATEVGRDRWFEFVC
jgi:hypothetical protein